jgi:hypothetical protein
MVPDWVPPAPNPQGPPQPVPIAPPRRFQPARTSLGKFGKGGSADDLRRGIGHYSRTGMGGSATAAQRMSGTANTAGGLYGVLDALSNETAIPTEVKLDPAALAGKSQTEVADIIADALRPIDGTQDSDAARDSIARALSEVLAADPNADLTNLDAVQIEQVVEAYLGHDLAHRIELDVGKAVLDKAASYSVGVDRLEEMKAYVRQAVAQAIRARRDIGQRLNQSNTTSLANEILRDTFEIFESYI